MSFPKILSRSGKHSGSAPWPLDVLSVNSGEHGNSGDPGKAGESGDYGESGDSDKSGESGDYVEVIFITSITSSAFVKLSPPV